jgi:hypothetical protein
MGKYPAFTVRSYPAFRPAREFRVFVSPNALYFIRLSGLVSASDAGSGMSLYAQERAMASVIRWFASKSQSNELDQIESADPAELVVSGKHHFQVSPSEVFESRLDPPSLFGGQRPAFGRWRLSQEGRKPVTYEIESAESLETALQHLPLLLKDKLKVNIGKR